MGFLQTPEDLKHLSISVTIHILCIDGFLFSCGKIQVAWLMSSAGQTGRYSAVLHIYVQFVCIWLNCSMHLQLFNCSKLTQMYQSLNYWLLKPGSIITQLGFSSATQFSVLHCMQHTWIFCFYPMMVKNPLHFLSWVKKRDCRCKGWVVELLQYFWTQLPIWTQMLAYLCVTWKES